MRNRSIIHEYEFDDEDSIDLASFHLHESGGFVQWIFKAFLESVLIGASASNPLDVLVIGGGANGSGVALGAVTRGLRVGLVEREDFSSGTSSRSTKLIHGGKSI
ncbi:unnamed protein product [Brassica napus]|uniref:glycerol-3-phosphate dehydrogenase n=1 Tax=Brassica napus TaxID=3708 RepID=A0A816SI79_BRANA|nr:unnamed protein product [Brassica napus]